MELEQRQQAMFQLHLSDKQFDYLLHVSDQQIYRCQSATYIRCFMGNKDTYRHMAYVNLLGATWFDLLGLNHCIWYIIWPPFCQSTQVADIDYLTCMRWLVKY